MDLTTRCPECGSTFDASLADLQLRKGYIRCPGCAHIFDGFEAVVPAVEASPQAASPDAPRGAAPRVVRHRMSYAPAPSGAGDESFTISSDHAGAGRPEPSVSEHGADDAGRPPEAARPEPVLGRFSAEHRSVAVEPSFEASRGSSSASSSGAVSGPHVFIEPRRNDSARVQADFLESEPISTRTIGFYFWGFLSLLGLVLLLLQGLYVYRVQLANQFPAMRPMLQAACAPLHCRIPYARDIDAIQIMSSALQSRQIGTAAPDGTQTMTLRFTLRNTLDKPQEWPTIIFSLLDFSGTVVVKKDIEPSSYLSSSASRGPFAAHSEAIVAVPVNIAGMTVSGFKLSKFFP